LKDCFLRNTCLNVGDTVQFQINQFGRHGKRRVACEVRVV
jgi:hypothetical protein